MDHLEKYTQTFRPIKESHPIFDDDDEENENPFKRGSLLANMRDSVDSFKIETSYDAQTRLYEEREVVKRLDFNKQQPDPEARPQPDKRPALQEKKQRADVVLPTSLLEDETAELRIERRQREIKQLIDNEKREMKREAVVSSRVQDSINFNLKKNKEPQVIRPDLAWENRQPTQVLNLKRIDQKVTTDSHRPQVTARPQTRL